MTIKNNSNYKILAQFTIVGQPPRKSNSRQVVPRKDGKVAVIKSKEALAYEEAFAQQVTGNLRMKYGSLSEDLAVEIVVYYGSRRPDLDVELILDCMEQQEIVRNDRYIVEKHEWGFVDKDNPRAVIRLYRILGDRTPPF